VFDAWPEVGIEDYEATAAALGAAGALPPESDALGWRGAMTHDNRRKLLEVVAAARSPDMYDVQETVWRGTQETPMPAWNHVSLVDGARRWRFQLDVEGAGYSGRLKLLFFSRRVVFVADRPHREWWMAALRPWEHYVPVKRDLSDLDARLAEVRSDPALEARIAGAGHAFALAHLRREHALARVADVMRSLAP
jgi:hypothetical protein